MPKRNITLPPVHNKRAPAQWDIIGKHVGFEGKTVLDLGCGGGDLMYRAWRAGASSIDGADNNAAVIASFPLDFIMHDVDINTVVADNHPGAYDIIICFSVLPYLSDPLAALRWIRDHSKQALIECQYSGDGPGFSWLKDDYDMRRWLEQAGFETIEPIGETLVKDRGTKRTIWLCQ